VGALTVLEKPPTTRLQVRVASHSLNFQAECGDEWTVLPVSEGYLVVAIDGLGHGREAAHAARRAVATITQFATATLEEIVRACDCALKGSRGAAISLARIDLTQQRLEWLGVGNVEGLVVTPAESPTTWHSETLVVRGGVVGYELPHLQKAHLPFGLDSVLVFATDGIKPGFSSEILAGRHPQEIADRIMSDYDRGTDDALVLVVRQMRSDSDRNA
jgi:negative regulator of sigma-B (phosphoserine phosphatase)